MGRDAIFRLVRSNGMLIRSRKRYARTTDSYHRFRIHPDLVQRRHAQRPEEIWVSDITYITTTSGFNYLSLVTDAFSRKIVGHHLSTDLKASGCIKALDMAVKSRLYPTEVLIHHSDRGTQYCCDDYVSRLKQEQILISMTQTGSPYDNAIAERVNGILKIELNLYEVFKSYKQASSAVESAMDRYNNLRLHASCNYQTPENAHKRNDVNKYQEENLTL